MVDSKLSRQILQRVKTALPRDILQAYDRLLSWVDGVLDAHREQARPVMDLSFPRLPGHYATEILQSTSVVVLEQCPSIPLSEFGLRPDDMPPADQVAGFALRDIYFVTPRSEHHESTHFHELVHVVQWRLLGDECFFHLYGAGLIAEGYRSSPLERIAYDLQSRFDEIDTDFDAADEVRRALERF